MDSARPCPEEVCDGGQEDPTRPKDGEDKAVSEAENENEELKFELLSQPPDRLRVPYNPSRLAECHSGLGEKELGN